MTNSWDERKQLESVILLCENCDKWYFGHEDIGVFYVGKVQSHFRRAPAGYIDKYDQADSVAIEIYSEANIKTFPSYSVPYISLFDRIKKYNDITAIEIRYTDHTSEHLFVCYEEDTEDNSSNLYQTTHISSLGNLYITIDTQNNPYFNEEYMEDKEMVGMYKKIYAIDQKEGNKYD